MPPMRRQLSMERIQSSQVTAFLATVARNEQSGLADYPAVLSRQAVDDPQQFWRTRWSVTGVIAKTAGVPRKMVI
jgi:hypothetical protein